MAVRVKFVPDEKEVEVTEGTNLLQAAAQAGVQVEGNCGGKGTCGKCKVKLISGSAGKATVAEEKFLSAQELSSGWVLACQREARENVIVEVVQQKDAYSRKTKLNKASVGVELDSAVEKVFVQLNTPSIKDQLADFERLLEALPVKEQVSRRDILVSLAGLLRDSNFQVTAVLADGRLIAVEPGDTTGRKFGVVFDIGTTTVVGFLLDLNKGLVLATSALTNPQNFFGADVISRINYAATEPEGLKQLHEKVLEAINQITGRLLKEAGVKQDEVYEAVMVGNTTMSHLVLGIDPTYLAPAPFIPVFTGAVETEAGELGLKIHHAGKVMMLPNIAGYVGSDTVGVMLATHMEEKEGYCLAVDIGTNGEVVLTGKGRVLTCSTAAGPAFEGAQIYNGMRAADGAIEAVAIKDGDVRLEMIGNEPARGICGSGLIDAIAEMLKSGIIESSGKIVDPEQASELHPKLRARIRPGQVGNEFLLVPGEASATGEDIVITQKDVRELQLGKGAIYAGIQVLLMEMGISETDLSQVLLAGAFGNYIRKESALAIGLLPNLDLDRIISIGNAAGDGAKMALVSRRERALALSLARRAEHIELSSRLDFQNEFIDALSFPG